MRQNNPFIMGAWAGASSIFADLSWISLDILGLNSLNLKLILVVAPLLFALLLVIYAVKVYGNRGPKPKISLTSERKNGKIKEKGE